MGKIKKIVLAYSGGLDTSVAIPWLKEKYGADIIAMIADVGQKEDLEAAKNKAIKSGASKAGVEDLKEEFANDFLFKLLKAGAVYEGRYLLGTSIARPVIAKRQVEVAKKEGADAVAHGATGKGNDQVRFELTYKALGPSLKIIAPWREWDIKGREDAIKYAKAKGIEIPVTKQKPYSSDANLWHISYEGGILEDPWKQPDDSMFSMTSSPEKAPDKPEYADIFFEKGMPIKVNGKSLSPAKLIEKLNEMGGRHGIGRVDIVENRLVGIKSRGVYETPGGTILMAAMRDLESITLDRETYHYKDLLSQKYAELVYNGQWFTPLREALDSFIERAHSEATGEIKVKLYKGCCWVAGRRSPNSLYDPKLATFEEEDIYSQKDAEGFINLFGLPIKVEALLRKKK